MSSEYPEYPAYFMIFNKNTKLFYDSEGKFVGHPKRATWFSDEDQEQIKHFVSTYKLDPNELELFTLKLDVWSMDDIIGKEWFK